MNLYSDNVTPACPEVIQALIKANHDDAAPYGEDAITKRLPDAFMQVFERDLAVFPVATGTAANALALSILCPAYGTVLAHHDSHLIQHECGAPEFFGGGLRVVGLTGVLGKLSPEVLEPAIVGSGPGGVHRMPASVVSITQETEVGTVYTIEQIRVIADLVHAHGLYLHMDGARLANAVVALNASPAEATWKAGVDVLSFGGTKNGAMAAEAVVVFRPELIRDLAFRRKRAGHLFSKMRFISAQLEALLENEVWLKNAQHAGQCARQLKMGLRQFGSVEFLYPGDANMLFVRMPAPVVAMLEKGPWGVSRWSDRESDVMRLVTGFDTDPADIQRFLESVQAHLDRWRADIALEATPDKDF